MIKTWAPRMGACLLLATTAIVSAMPVVAQAQAAARVAFDIPASDTAAALNAFSRQAGVQLMFPYEVAARHRTDGLKGAFGREEALRKLIQGASGDRLGQCAGDHAARPERGPFGRQRRRR